MQNFALLPPEPWYLRALLIALSTFCGATAAFLLARLARKRDERIEKIAAGNAALFALVDQFNTLRMLDNGYLSQVKSSPNRWIELQEVVEVPAYLRLSSANLNFLIRGGADATILLRLHEAERNADIALQTIKSRNAFYVDEIRPRLLPIYERAAPAEHVPVPTIVSVLGPLHAGLRERTDAVYETFEAALAANEAAFRALQQHLVKKFPRAQFLDRKIVKGV